MKRNLVWSRRGTAMASVLFVFLSAPIPALALPVTPADCVLPGDSRCEIWTTRIDGGRYDQAVVVAASSSGDRIFLAGKASPTNSSDFVTTALSSAGTVLWERRLPGGEIPLSATVTPDNSSVVVAGQGGGAHVSVVAYNAVTGEQQWVATYDGGHGYDAALDVVSSPDGTMIFAAAASLGPEGPNDVDYVTLGIDRMSGAIRWATRSSSPGEGNDNPLAIAISPDGRTVATTGWWRDGFAGNSQALSYGTIAYDSDGGAVRWINKFTAPDMFANVGRDVGFSPDSALVYVTGGAQRPNFPRVRSDFGTVAYNTATGAEVWAQRYNECEDCIVSSLAIGPDGTVYVGGSDLQLTDTGSQFRFAAVAYDGKSGARKWVGTYGFPALHVFIPNIGLSPNGQRVYLAGVSQQSNTNQLTTVALNAADGATLWDARYGPPSIGATSINPSAPPIVTAPGRVYVAATAGVGGVDSDRFIAAYESG
jgi:hypothetical protein